MKARIVKRNRIRNKVTNNRKLLATTGDNLKIQKLRNEVGVLKKFNIQLRKVFSAILTICSLVVFASCNTPAENVIDAKESVKQANKELDEAQEEYRAEVEQFRAEADKKLTENEILIAEITKNMKNNSEKISSVYNNRLASFEQKNEELQKKINTYKAETKEDWLAFKTEFNSDMDDLRIALKHFLTGS